jgi:hypothetical protein
MMDNPVSRVAFAPPMTAQEVIVYKSVLDKYLITDFRNGNKKIISNTCIDLDRDIKKINDDITKITIEEPNNKFKKDLLLYGKGLIVFKFNNFDCTNKIEETRFDESANLITKTSINQEKTILGKSNLENNIYILIGASMLITAFVILIKK